jgi:hypothetical protein
MSALRNIVMFMLCFQLGLQLTNFIQIQGPTPGMPDGLFLKTGEITPFTIWYDPMSSILLAINETTQALQPTIPGNCTIPITATCNANYYVSCNGLDQATCTNAWVYEHGLRFNCQWGYGYFYPAGRCELTSGGSCDCAGEDKVTYSYRFLNAVSWAWTINKNDYFTIGFSLLGVAVGWNTGLPIGQLMNIVGLVSFILVSGVNIMSSFLMIILIVLFNVTIGAVPFYVNLFSKIDPVMGSLLGVCVGGVQMFVIGWELNKEAGKVLGIIAGIVKLF